MPKPLMQAAKASAATKRNVPSFKRPNIAALVPPAMKDTVDRVVAAGMKLMYSPQMKQEVQQAIQSDKPVPQKLAESVTGLLLVLDQQASGGGQAPTPPGAPPAAAAPTGQPTPPAPGMPAGAGQPPTGAPPQPEAPTGEVGGIPPEALFPAGMELLSEASAVLAAAGQDVTIEDYNDAALMMFAQIGQKLGGTPDQIMQAAQQAIPGGGDEGATDTAPPDEGTAEQPGAMQ